MQKYLQELASYYSAKANVLESNSLYVWLCCLIFCVTCNHSQPRCSVDCAKVSTEGRFQCLYEVVHIPIMFLSLDEREAMQAERTSENRRKIVLTPSGQDDSFYFVFFSSDITESNM